MAAATSKHLLAITSNPGLDCKEPAHYGHPGTWRLFAYGKTWGWSLAASSSLITSKHVVASRTQALYNHTGSGIEADDGKA